MGYTVHYDSDFLPGKYLAYSKHNLRQYYNKKFGAPLIKAGFSYGGDPCYGFNRDRMIFYQFESDAMQFLIEKEDTVRQCPVYDWRNRTFDSRYDNIGEITLHQLQLENGVLDAIDKIIPLDYLSSDDRAFGIEARKNVDLRLFTQTLFSWDHKCDRNESTSSKSFYDTLQSISHYFKPHEEQLAETYELFWEPAPPEHIEKTVITLQVILIGYQLVILLVFTFQTSCLPQIRAADRLLKREKVKHCVI